MQENNVERVRELIEEFRKIQRLEKLKDPFVAEAEQNLLHYCAHKNQHQIMRMLVDTNVFNLN